MTNWSRILHDISIDIAVVSDPYAVKSTEVLDEDGGSSPVKPVEERSVTNNTTVTKVVADMYCTSQ